MLRLKPLQQRRKRQNVHQRMEETHMDKWVCIEPVHCIHAISRLSPISAPPPFFPKKAVDSEHETYCSQTQSHSASTTPTPQHSIESATPATKTQ